MATYSIPKKIGTCADKLYKTQNERYALQKEIDKLKEIETLLKNHIIDTLPKDQLSGVSGKLANVSVNTKSVPQVDDWPLFYKHIKRTGNFELLGRAIGKKAVRERWEAGKEVPGVTSHTVVGVSIKKV